MAFWNITGNSQVTTYDANGFASGTDVDNGTVRYGGTVAGSRFEADALDGISEPVTIVSGADGITGVVGTFNGGDRVIMRVTSDIAGVGNSGLFHGSSNSANVSNSINQVAVVESRLYKTAVRNGQWNAVSGVFSPAISVVNSGAWDIEAGVDVSSTVKASGSDDAANPTQDVPGELVYNYGSGNNPTQDEYKPRTNW